jgi:hypothetical protein
MLLTASTIYGISKALLALGLMLLTVFGVFYYVAKKP